MLARNSLQPGLQVDLEVRKSDWWARGQHESKSIQLTTRVQWWMYTPPSRIPASIENFNKASSLSSPAALVRVARQLHRQDGAASAAAENLNIAQWCNTVDLAAKQ
jgi:hypothetical protein